MKKILLIEDNDDIRNNIAEILELSNYSVIAAENGITGIEQAMQNSPDLITCDITMPVLCAMLFATVCNQTDRQEMNDRTSSAKPNLLSFEK